MIKVLLSLQMMLCLSQMHVFAQKEGADNHNLQNGIAIQGYDPVSFFDNQKPLKGNSRFQENVDGIIYYFATEEHQDLFADNPSKYQPAYGGWCAYAMGAGGTKVKIDPKTYKIVDGKLYLFYNFYFNNTLNKWNEDEVKLKNSADVFWQKIIAN